MPNLRSLHIAGEIDYAEYDTYIEGEIDYAMHGPSKVEAEDSKLCAELVTNILSRLCDCPKLQNLHIEAGPTVLKRLNLIFKSKGSKLVVCTKPPPWLKYDGST